MQETYRSVRTNVKSTSVLQPVRDAYGWLIPRKRTNVEGTSVLQSVRDAYG